MCRILLCVRQQIQMNLYHLKKNSTTYVFCLFRRFIQYFNAFGQTQQTKLVSKNFVNKTSSNLSMATTMWQFRLSYALYVYLTEQALCTIISPFLFRSHSIYFSVAHLEGSKMWPDFCDYIFPYSKNVLGIFKLYLKHAIDSNIFLSHHTFAV